MAKLIWDVPGERTFEAGVDRGVLYPNVGSGVVWNGLISVDETPSGGTVTPYYIDGVKYLNETTPHDYSASITAFTYPDVLDELNGLTSDGLGLYFDEQLRDEFGLTYRTMIGNAVEGFDNEYKIHLVYGISATPKDTSYTTMTNISAPINFQWTIVGTPMPVVGKRPTAHFIFDTTKSKRFRVDELERILYGSSTTAPRLPTPTELVSISNYGDALEIVPATATGLAKLTYRGTKADLRGDVDLGLYTKHPNSRLVPTATPGFSTLGA